ncbi:hypothetical protein MTO96_008120 [Rhipicephalus appendiculatus]
MEIMRAQSTRKRPRVPVADAIKKLCRLSDNPDLVVYGETAEESQRHHEWLAENAITDTGLRTAASPPGHRKKTGMSGCTARPSRRHFSNSHS